MFSELYQLHDSNPRGYMNLVISLRRGSFDKKMPDDSSFVTPDRWQQHFSELLGPPVSPTPEELEGYGNNGEGSEQDPGYEQEAPGATTERSFFGLKMSNVFGGDDDCAVGADND